MVIDYSDHTDVLKVLKRDQEAEVDNREAAREATHFLNKRDGQWEPGIVSKFANRPRYTFDKCNPVVDQIVGEIEQSNFDISVLQSGGNASKKVALTYDGLIRNIENISNAEFIYSAAARGAVSSGLDGWRIAHDWVDDNTFDQDLIIKKISNFIDRVWFDCNAEQQDMSDANHVFILQSLTLPEYEKKFPEGSNISVDEALTREVYFNKKESIVVGEILYKKMTSRELVLMSNGAVYEVDDKFKSLVKDLKANGIVEMRRRERKVSTVHSRFFDGGGWISDSKKTVFDMLPVVPEYANFKIVENKVIYWGAVEKLMDPQRVYNYAKSRQIEEGALAPRSKYWMTVQQAENQLEKLRTMNTNADPVQFYTHVDGVPPPYVVAGSQINPGLQQLADDVSKDINVSAGLFQANMGDNPGLQSGVAIEQLQLKGDNGTYKYFTSHRLAITHTARILVKAIPKVYDTKRQVRLLGPDGAVKLETINDKVVTQNGLVEEINNLSVGTYDVVCTVGPSFKNRQRETVKTITEMATVDPTILEIGSDVLLDNIQAPGIAQIAERKRDQMVRAGLIPESQLTDEERQLVEKLKAEPPKPTPVEQAMIAQAQAEAEKAQANTADIQSKIAERDKKFELEKEKVIAEMNTQSTKMALEIQKLQAKITESAQNTDLQIQAQALATQRAMDEQVKIQAETLKILREAMGVDAILGKQSQEAFVQQADRIVTTQETQETQ